MTPIVAIFLIVLVDVCAFTLVIPLLPLYAEKLGATPLDATLLVSAFAFFQLVSGPILGRLSDKLGRKPVLIASQIGTLFGLLVLAWAKSLWVVYVARIIDGATAGNISLAQAYISDHTKPEERAKSFGKIYIAFGIGFFIGPFSTGLLSGYGLTAPIYAGAALSLLSIFATIFLLPSEAKDRAAAAAAPKKQAAGVFDLGGYFKYFKRPVLNGVFAETLFFGFCFATFTSGIALYAERRFEWDGHPFGAREVAFHFAFIGFLGIVLQTVFMARLVRWFGETNVTRAGFVSLALGYLGLTFVHSVGPLAAVTVLTVFGHGVLRPTLSSLATQNAGKGEQGVVLGITQSLASISQIGAPALSGFLIDHELLDAWTLVAVAVAVVGLVAGRWGSTLHAAKKREAASGIDVDFALAAPLPAPAPSRLAHRFAAALAVTALVCTMGGFGALAVRLAVAHTPLAHAIGREATPPPARATAELTDDPVDRDGSIRKRGPRRMPRPERPERTKRTKGKPRPRRR